MKRFLIIIFLTSILITGCASDDNNGNGNDNIDNDRNTPETIVEPEDDTIEEDMDEDIDKSPATDGVDLDIGLEAPDFTLTNLKGEEVTLSDYRGKIVLVNFWATWCHWCDVEMPDLNKLDVENEDLVVLGVNFMENGRTVRKYLEEGGYEFEVVLDVYGEIAEKYLVDGLPNSYFLDKEGLLQLAYPGMLTYEQMIGVVDAIMDMD